MPWTIIVASDEGYQLEQLMEAAQEIATAIPEPGTVVMEAESIEEVRKRRRTAGQRSQLLIVAATLPDEANPTADASGLELIRSSAQEADAPPCILVSYDPNHLAPVQEIEGCELLFANCKTNYVQDCLRLAKRLKVFANSPAQLPPAADSVLPASDAPASPREIGDPATNRTAGEAPPYVVIEVHLSEKGQFLVLPGQSPMLLELNENQVEDIIRESRAMADRIDIARRDKAVWQSYVRTWREEYKQLGERVGRLLWPTIFGPWFWASFSASDGNVRLRFNLDRKYFDGAWEAIYDHQVSKDFVMLGEGVTVARRSNHVDPRNISKSGKSLSTSTRIEAADGVLRMLVINSNVPDGATPVGPPDPLWDEFWRKQDGELAELPHVTREVEMLEGLRRAKGGVDKAGQPQPHVKVEVLSSEPGIPLAKIVEHRLKDRTRHYDVVHFAGHALFDRSQTENADRRGYLVFSGEPGGHPTAVPIGSVAEWLRGSEVQLVYLSCCRSSSGDAASELAALKVPLTIGFNWNLDDAKAVDFARDFYTELLGARLRVCEAFHKARRALHTYFNGGDPIWAAPVLIAQPHEWIQVEGVLRPSSERLSTPGKPPVGRRRRKSERPSQKPMAA